MFYVVFDSAMGEETRASGVVGRMLKAGKGQVPAKKRVVEVEDWLGGSSSVPVEPVNNMKKKLKRN